MKIVRTITYEGTEEQLTRQMKMSLRDGEYPGWLTSITIQTIQTDLPELQGMAPENWTRQAQECECPT